MDHLDHARLVKNRTLLGTLRRITATCSCVDSDAEPFLGGRSSSGNSSYAPAAIANQTRVHFISRYTPIGTAILSAAFAVLTLQGFEHAPPIRHANPSAPASCPVGFQRWWPHGREFDERATQCIKTRGVKAGSSKGKKVIDSVSHSSGNPVLKTGLWK